ncbi:uncharacterized protein SPSK_04323 [Sporothrix schenckii 1099-18]|uniref:Uncharacterized protein n=2 Tax=Sporothrix schenckii TaxID=29908 RepID=U7PMP5_SPOS1|nr:uncharacterized protein SPSK_04323 [Sporothrix schenckii 1099-18]ERS95785.1 hypothetical protein HMPREF1624_07860 [Sporothrix schenckii ATCC 58251]KJR83805.1 hypothetical protein SPSK_04323 [Sporothrix schenckii 1099-18]
MAPIMLMNTHPRLYPKWWWDPPASSSLYIPPPSRETVCTLPVCARKMVDSRVQNASEAIVERQLLESFFYRDFACTRDVVCSERKVVLAFAQLPQHMRAGLEDLHVMLCRMVVAHACCENRMGHAADLARYARMIHAPGLEGILDGWMYERCATYEHYKAIVDDEGTAPEERRTAEMRMTRALLNHFYRLTGLTNPVLRQASRFTSTKRPCGPDAMVEDEKTSHRAPLTKKPRLSLVTKPAACLGPDMAKTARMKTQRMEDSVVVKKEAPEHSHTKLFHCSYKDSSSEASKKSCQETFRKAPKLPSPMTVSEAFSANAKNASKEVPDPVVVKTPKETPKTLSQESLKEAPEKPSEETPTKNPAKKAPSPSMFGDDSDSSDDDYIGIVAMAGVGRPRDPPKPVPSERDKRKEIRDQKKLLAQYSGSRP